MRQAFRPVADPGPASRGEEPRSIVRGEKFIAESLELGNAPFPIVRADGIGRRRIAPPHDLVARHEKEGVRKPCGENAASLWKRRGSRALRGRDRLVRIRSRRLRVALPSCRAFSRIDREDAGRSFSEFRSAQHSNASPISRASPPSVADRKGDRIGACADSARPERRICDSLPRPEALFPNPPALSRDDVAHGGDESRDASFRLSAGRVKPALASVAHPG